jgi:uncharacterized membrane protein
LLFWLSMVPFGTAWLGRNPFAATPVALYGVLLLMAGVACYVLEQTLISANGRDSALAKALGKDVKGKASIAIYAIALLLAFWIPIASCVLYAAVAVMWFVPDRRIESMTES